MEYSSLSFRRYLEEDLITFKRTAYPKYGHAVILAGGAGSGKGFIINNLLGIDAKVLDPDALKSLAIKSKSHLNSAVKNFSNVKDWDLKNPNHVSDLHTAMASAGIEHRQKTALKNSVPLSKFKPNIIIDTTLSNFDKFEKVTDFIKSMGYEDENIHLVWVINDFELASKQNAKRERVVSDEIMKMTHAGAKTTLDRIYKLSSGVSYYLDGDIWYVFNKQDVDTTLIKSNTGKKIISKATYFKVKSSGSNVIQKIPQNILNKITSYTDVNR